MACQSFESGRPEINVVRLADPGRKRRLTNDGGGSSIWGRDGKRLSFVSNDRILLVALRSASDLRCDAPVVVNKSDVPGRIDTLDVALDGTSVLVGRLADPLMLRRDIRLWPGWGKTSHRVTETPFVTLAGNGEENDGSRLLLDLSRSLASAPMAGVA